MIERNLGGPRARGVVQRGGIRRAGAGIALHSLLAALWRPRGVVRRGDVGRAGAGIALNSPGRWRCVAICFVERSDEPRGFMESIGYL